MDVRYGDLLDMRTGAIVQLEPRCKKCAGFLNKHLLLLSALQLATTAEAGSLACKGVCQDMQEY